MKKNNITFSSLGLKRKSSEELKEEIEEEPILSEEERKLFNHIEEDPFRITFSSLGLKRRDL